MHSFSTVMNTNVKPILVTTGEPAGIGMDIVIDVLAHHAHGLTTPLVICADKVAFTERITKLCQNGMNASNVMDLLTVLDVGGDYQHLDLEKLIKNKPSSTHYLLHIPCDEPVVAGVLNVANAGMVQAQLDVAHHLASTAWVGAIVTAPLQKSVMIDGGVTLDNGDKFSGHTEYFMCKAGVDKVVMMLANTKMRVALVTTHLPLKEVSNAITAHEVHQTVAITHAQMVAKFGVKNPKILVCGLNPHAGEGGHLGDEEIHIINPVLQEFRDGGMDISLAMPADTLFTEKYLQTADAIIAMYHDQGLAPLKSHGFGDTVNITLGLPYVRTSVDHGTALDLAGTTLADSRSLRCAILMANQMMERSV